MLATSQATRTPRVTGPESGRLPICYAHRGARAHAPENTVLAFDVAFDLGADGVECDVQLSADGQPVIIHDGSVNRTTDGRGPVRAMTYDALQRLNAGYGQRVPSLEETLALVRARGGWLNLEVKAESDAEAEATARVVAASLNALTASDALRQRLLISSFNLPALEVMRQLAPWASLGALYGGRGWTREAMISRALALGAVAIHPHPRILSAETTRAAHEAGLRVNVWTANRRQTIRTLLAWGVDGVFSDFPERVIVARALAAAPPAPTEPAKPAP